MIDPHEIITKQLNATEKGKVVLNDGSTTVITPVRYTPQLADPAMQLALTGDASTWKVSRWPFGLAEVALAAPDMDDSAWPAVRQPGKVFYADPEENPATVPNWNRVTLEHIDPDDGAMLRRTVRIPPEWAGCRIFLRFDAVYPAARFYCNGTFLGEHLSGLTPVEWDVTGIAAPGETATVAVRLLRRHKWVRIDMPRHAMEFTGISQHACFHAVRQCHVADYRLVTDLDDSCRCGAIAGTVTLRNATDASRSCLLTVSLKDGETVLSSVVRNSSVPPAGTRDVHIVMRADYVTPWNDENPKLYDVEMKLEVDGQPPQTVCYRTGFRLFELRDQRPTLNGRPVKFRGVNHLTYSLDGGMYTSEEWLRKCLTLMKRANINCIRTHYLGPRVLAHLCDEMGIYLVQELPIDWGTDYVHNKETVGPVLMRLEGGVRRDRHHPSVMIWSIGNENMPPNMEVHDDFYNHLRIYDQFVKELDGSRPTMFPPPGPAGKMRGIFETRLGDIADTHYSFVLARQLNDEGRIVNPETWDGATETVTRDEAMARGWSGVWFSSEYGIANLIPDLLNAPYISIISDLKEDALSGKNTLQVFIDRLRYEWNYMRDDPTCLGGAYFPWLCAGTGDPWGWTRWGEDADWGIVTADLTPKPMFWAMRVIFSPVQFPERLAWKKGQTELTFNIHNGYNSIDLAQCTLRTMFGMATMREWRDVPISCPPGCSQMIRIPVWAEHTRKTLDEGRPAVCRCILLDPSGFRPITADILIVPEQAQATCENESIAPEPEKKEQ